MIIIKINIVDRILRRDKNIKVSISNEIKNNKHKLFILDSYCIQDSSLYNLVIKFDVDTVKSVFPYKFSNENNFFYIGPTPLIHFYNDISIEEYNKIYMNN